MVGCARAPQVSRTVRQYRGPVKIPRCASHHVEPAAQTWSLIAALIASSVVSSGCVAFRGHAQLDVPSEPIQFIDGHSGEIIPDVLVLPRYSSSSGASTGAGHGPGVMDSTVYVAGAFTYRAGDRFQPMQPKSSGVMVGPAWAFLGTGRSIDGVLIVAPGYASRFISDLWTDRPDKCALAPLPKPDAVAELGDIQRLLDLEIVNGDGRLRWDLGGEHPLYVRLTDSERQLTTQFITQGLARLNVQAGP